MKKVMITLIMVIVCSAALFADVLIIESEDSFILGYSLTDRVSDLEIPGKTWTYYERFEVNDPEILDQYMSRFMGYLMNFDSDTLDMRVAVDGSNMACVITSDLELINSLAGV